MKAGVGRPWEGRGKVVVGWWEAGGKLVVGFNNNAGDMRIQEEIRLRHK